MSNFLCIYLLFYIRFAGLNTGEVRLDKEWARVLVHAKMGTHEQGFIEQFVQWSAMKIMKSSLSTDPVTEQMNR